MPCVLLVYDHYYLLLLDASKKSSCTHFLPYYQKREMNLMLELFLSTVYLCYSEDFFLKNFLCEFILLICKHICV